LGQAARHQVFEQPQTKMRGDCIEAPQRADPFVLPMTTWRFPAIAYGHRHAPSLECFVQIRHASPAEHTPITWEEEPNLSSHLAWTVPQAEIVSG
jgi:hypothetical protein